MKAPLIADLPRLPAGILRPNLRLPAGIEARYWSDANMIVILHVKSGMHSAIRVADKKAFRLALHSVIEAVRMHAA